MDLNEEAPVTEPEPTCGFCGKQGNEVAVLIAAPSTHICDECVGICMEIVAEKQATADVSDAVTILTEFVASADCGNAERRRTAMRAVLLANVRMTEEVTKLRRANTVLAEGMSTIMREAERATRLAGHGEGDGWPFPLQRKKRVIGGMKGQIPEGLTSERDVDDEIADLMEGNGE